MDVFRMTGDTPINVRLQLSLMAKNLHHRGKTITFINGIGDGILKTAIRKESDEVLALRCSYSVGDPAVTIVTIKCPFLLLCWNPLTPYW